MSVKEKVQKEYADFTKEIDSLSVEQLEDRIVGMQKALEESEEHRENNEDLKAARALTLELSGPYRDIKKAVRLKTKYILELLTEKGGAQ